MLLLQSIALWFANHVFSRFRISNVQKALLFVMNLLVPAVLRALVSISLDSISPADSLVLCIFIFLIAAVIHIA